MFELIFCVWFRCSFFQSTEGILMVIIDFGWITFWLFTLVFSFWEMLIARITSIQKQDLEEIIDFIALETVRFFESTNKDLGSKSCTIQSWEGIEAVNKLMKLSNLPNLRNFLLICQFLSKRSDQLTLKPLNIWKIKCQVNTPKFLITGYLCNI